MQSLETKGIEIFELDVTNSESIASARAHVEKLTSGKLDILVNNAYAWLSIYVCVHLTPFIFM